MSRTAVLIAAMLLATIPAAAQDVKPVEFQIGGGMTFPNSEVRDFLGDGYNFNIGLTFNVNPNVGIETLYSFNGLGQKQISIPVSQTPIDSTVPTDFFGDMNMQFGTVNLVVRKSTGGVRPYMVTGVGIYYRPITVTTPAVGFGPGLLQPLLVLLQLWRFCPGRRSRRRAQLHRLRHGHRRRNHVRECLLCRGALSLHLGSERGRRRHRI